MVELVLGREENSNELVGNLKFVLGEEIVLNFGEIKVVFNGFNGFRFYLCCIDEEFMICGDKIMLNRIFS